MTLLNEHLEHQVKQLFLNSKELSSQRIDVLANNGQIRLEGNVQTFRRKLAAQELVERDPQVKQVINNLVVAPSKPFDDLRLTSDVNHRVQSDNRIVKQAIRVDARDGDITLSGYTSTALERKLAIDIAASVDGVRGIHDMLVVNPDRVLANHESATSIAAAIGRIIGLEHDNFMISVVDQAVRVMGEVDALWKKEAVEQTIRKFGILRVGNEIVVTGGDKEK